ncbi:hypothetical protein ACFW6R_29385 [Streptomyces albidoflavus]
MFSLHDALTGVTDGEELGYLVVGWYSDPAADVLVGFPGEADFATWLAGELGWTVASVAPPPPRSTTAWSTA